MDEPQEQQLPPEVRASIEKGIRDGVSFSMERKDRRHEVTEIHWRPGDPNALADAIISYVDREMPLNLDGRRYLVRPDDGYAELAASETAEEVAEHRRILRRRRL